MKRRLGATRMFLDYVAGLFETVQVLGWIVGGRAFEFRVDGN